MPYLIIAAILLITPALWIGFLLKRRKKADFIQFRKRVYLKRKPGSKRSRQLLFDRDRGKVIPFPLTSVSSHGKELTDPRETRT